MCPEAAGQTTRTPDRPLSSIGPDLPGAVWEALRRLLTGCDIIDPKADAYRAALQQAPVAGSGKGDAPALMDCFARQHLPRGRASIPDPSEYQALATDTVAGVFGPDGDLASRLPGYETRDGQVVMARGVADAFNASRHLMVEAGTGIGKSLAYLVPSVLWAARNGTPVVISTNTKNLQAQLFEKDLPLLRRVLDVPFSAALIKGRMNYLCLRKLLNLIEHADVELLDPERVQVADALLWALRTQTGDIGELLDCTGPLGVLTSRLTSTGEECLGRGCFLGSRCFLRRARAAAQAADIVVANHSLVFAEMGLVSPALPPYAHIVFDEAHNLEASATQHFSIEISAFRMRLVLSRLWLARHGRGGRRGSGLLAIVDEQIKSGALPGTREALRAARAAVKTVRRALRGARGAMEIFFTALEQVLDAGGKDNTLRFDSEFMQAESRHALCEARGNLSDALRAVADAVQQLMDALNGLSGDELPLQQGVASDLQAQAGTLRELCLDLDFVMSARDAAYVFWVERLMSRSGGARAWAAPIRIGDRLAAEVYALKASVIFSSATLSVNGSFNFLKRRLGLDLVEADRIHAMTAASPFDYARQCRVLVPMFLDEPDRDGSAYARQLGEMLADVFRATRGRGLVLFTSYRMLRETTQAMNGCLGSDSMDVLVQGSSGSREAITAAFKEDYESVLMGTHSFWEGVDAMGETLSCLVLARLPFAVFTEPVTQARCEQIEAEGGNAFTHYALPGAVIRFRQGFGRLIRHRNDRGIVIVADKRILTRRYGNWFRGSVSTPVCRAATGPELMEAIEAFFASA